MLPPALVDIRAPRLLTDRVEVFLPHELFYVPEILICVEFYFEPVRLSKNFCFHAYDGIAKYGLWTPYFRLDSPIARSYCDAMRIRYNAPVTLSFALLASLVLILTQSIAPGLRESFFVVGPTMNPANPLDYLRLVTHVVGHSSWSHLMGNFAFILLLGPILEEKYGSTSLLIMIVITAIVTGLLNILFLPTGLLGASGVVFMMILLSSFTNIRQGEIPLTFILIVVLYLVQEVAQSLRDDSVSQFAHISGGIIGSLFGFIRPNRS